ncbi:MAG: hypothetical protein R6X25_10105 [Candidatus Krumholzibacteriia bacterium]
MNLVSACGIAFSAVFLLLAVLAALMQVMTVVFPERKPKTDSALVAAISSTVASLLPGARVTRIEEES